MKWKYYIWNKAPSAFHSYFSAMKCMGNDGPIHGKTLFNVFDHFSCERTFDDLVSAA